MISKLLSVSQQHPAVRSCPRQLSEPVEHASLDDSNEMTVCEELVLSPGQLTRYHPHPRRLKIYACDVIGCCSHVQLFAILWTAACQASLPMGSFRQEYWTGLHFFLQGSFPTQGSNPSLLCLLHCRWVLYHWCHPRFE